MTNGGIKMKFASNLEIALYYARNTSEGKMLHSKAIELFRAEERAENDVLKWEDAHHAEAPMEMYQAMYDAQKASKAASKEFESAWKAWAAANDEQIEMLY